MRYGRGALPEGFLPVYSVGDEEEAKALLIMSCGRNLAGEFVASELAREQTLDNLQAFSDKLHERHAMLKKAGRCRCVTSPAEGRTLARSRGKGRSSKA